MLNRPADFIVPELPRGVDVAAIAMMPTAGPVPRLRLAGKYIRYAPLQYQHFFARLEGSFADYLEHFSSKSRATVLRKVRKFQVCSGGRIDYRSFSGGDEMPEFHRWASAISVKTYQEKLFQAGIPRYETFAKQVQAADDVRGYVLFHQGVPVSYLFCPIYNGVLLYDTLGYDLAFREWSPGTVLQFLAFESLFREGHFSMFDFGQGEGQHKQLFSTDNVHSVEMYYFRRNLSNYAIVLLHSGVQWVSASAGSLLMRLGIKSTIRNWFRASAVQISRRP
jgi:hypothetical protein